MYVLAKTCNTEVKLKKLIYFRQLQVYHNSIPEDFAKESVVSVLDRSDATASHLNMRSFKGEVEAIYSGTEDRVVAIAFEKVHPQIAVGISVFKAKDIHSSRVLSFPLLQPIEFAASTNRNKYWEVSYCVRKPACRGMSVGAVCLAGCLEAVRGLSEEKGYTANIWLVVSGSFQNQNALRLYMDYQFIMQGVCEDEVSLLMLVKDFEGSKYEKAKRTLER